MSATPTTFLTRSRLIARSSQFFRSLTATDILWIVLGSLYVGLFYRSISEYWFSAQFTTDDAYQQAYPFYEALYPDRFKGDLVTTMMKSYLAPLHYWLGFGITKLTRDVFMTCHWMMLIQVGLTVGFLFAAVRRATSGALPPAIFAVLWLLNTRNTIQRMTCGLPRGWAPVLFAAFFYFVISRNHWGVLATLLLGCLLNPVATMLVAIAYGLYLLIQYVIPSSRREFSPHFWRLVWLSPVFILLVLSVTRMAPEVGHMASYAQAQSMAEFNPGGRFPFLPLADPWTELRQFGFQSFSNVWFAAPAILDAMLPWIVLGLLGLLLVVGIVRRREVIPLPIVLFFVAAVLLYFASRAFAFHLYVPNRHVQIPWAMFFVTALTIGVWQVLNSTGAARKRGSAGLLALAAFVLINYGPGMLLFDGDKYLVRTDTGEWLWKRNAYAVLNFNVHRNIHGRLWTWIDQKTPPDSLIAGDPVHVDPAPLFSLRKVFVSNETAHPFYDAYYTEIKRRLGVTYRAMYAKGWQEFFDLVDPEGIDFFVFKRENFYPDKLARAGRRINKPLDTLVESLTSAPLESFAYKSLPQEIDLEVAPFVTFRDRLTVVVDVAKLTEYLAARQAA